MHDIVVIGAGPGGLTAAIYALRANKSVLVLEKESFGGQITYSPKVENYPGFAEGVAGPEFSQILLEQAQRFGAAYIADEVMDIQLDGSEKQITGKLGTYSAKTVILAMGAGRKAAAAIDEYLKNKK